MKSIGYSVINLKLLVHLNSRSSRQRLGEADHTHIIRILLQCGIGTAIVFAAVQAR